jgi:hypothetical protein
VPGGDNQRRRNLMKLSGPVLTFALHAEADVTASVIERCRSEQTLCLPRAVTPRRSARG